MSARPPISVIVPFAGDSSAAATTISGLSRLRRKPDDEVIVADNTLGGCDLPPQNADFQVVRATHERSAYHARNAGAEHARNPWLLFIDADCRPSPSLLDDYFDPPPSDECGLVAGAVRPAPDQPGFAPRYARSRGQLQEDWHAQVRPGWPHPAGVTGNLLIRAAAWRELGGFHEGIASGGDVEMSWRLQDAGWRFERRTGATVEHAHVESLGAMARQARRHGAGRRWVSRRYPGAFPRPPLIRPLARCAAGAMIWMLTGRVERALFKLADARWNWAGFRGYVFGDNGTGTETSPAGPALLLDSFPAPGDVPPQGAERVEAFRRPARVDRALARRLEIRYAEDDPPVARAGFLFRLACAHPLRLAHVARRRRELTMPLAALAPVAARVGARGWTASELSDGDGAAIAALAGSGGGLNRARR